jgi:phosphatidylserine/phosphatidylglycerophosphate/cardiolipin synthase-like enzyme
MLQLSRFSDVIAAVERGRDIAVSSYTLSGRLMRAIEARARCGAHVSVTLEADPSARDPEPLRRRNCAAAAKLRACGVDARLEDNVHSKSLAVDDTVFFDGSNWREGDVILRTDAAGTERIAALKSAALSAEGEMLERARDRRECGAIVETESFNRFNVVAKALREMAEDGLSPRLLVGREALRGNVREAASLAKAVAEGVDVRVCSDTEKFALAGDRAWLGSANATGAFAGHDMTDWGVVTEDPAIVAAVRERIEKRWASARELQPLSVA